MECSDSTRSIYKNEEPTYIYILHNPEKDQLSTQKFRSSQESKENHNKHSKFNTRGK